ncbi:hypothetical protein GCM10020331_091280 [Ectobacillus funiculus]
MAGDVIGDYSFDQPLKHGDRLVFGDMAIYSMVKKILRSTVWHSQQLRSSIKMEIAKSYVNLDIKISKMRLS